MKALEKNIKIVQTLDDSISDKIIFDKTRLRQIMFNLVGNAIKFTEEGQITISANAKRKQDDAKFVDLSIIVNDTGIGVNQEDQQIIFDSFTQQDGKSTRKYGGSGLGLTICHRLTTLLNGTISLNSEVNVGSTFNLLFKNVEIVPELELDNGIFTFDPKTITFLNSKILVVDDVEMNRKLLETNLTRKGVEVLSAENGLEAIKLAQKNHPDLIIMDIMMPVMDGVEAVKNLKQNDQTKDIPVIALTAFLEDENRSKFLKIGFEACLHKPVNIKELYSELIKYLDFSA
jgi:CheY-like chemotaxis protein/anti-sigma regulatory factor (Ser/Thr protein kinase)